MPRRNYTVTAKVLAACRRNLEKANAVPKSHRYRPTPRRLAACHRNLEKAHATLRTALQSSLRAPGRRTTPSLLLSYGRIIKRPCSASEARSYSTSQTVLSSIASDLATAGQKEPKELCDHQGITIGSASARRRIVPKPRDSSSHFTP